MKKTTYFLIIQTSIWLIPILPAAAQAQDRLAQRGVLTTGTYTASNIETIDTVSGNVLYKILLAVLPLGRAGFSWGLEAIYNSAIYDVNVSTCYSQNGGVWTNCDFLQASPFGGWQYSYKYSLNWGGQSWPIQLHSATASVPIKHRIS